MVAHRHTHTADSRKNGSGRKDDYGLLEELSLLCMSSATFEIHFQTEQQLISYWVVSQIEKKDDFWDSG